MSQVEQIAVTGGKGGVGKSTISILLANQLAKNEKIVLVDADVECPNDYLLLNKDLTEPVKKVFAFYPQLNKDKCIKCGLCAQKCRFNAILMPKNDYPQFFDDLCANCGLCWQICPQQAITPKKEVTANLYENPINENLLLITGEAKSQVDETGPVVRQLRTYALKRAQEFKAKRIVIDTAPGTHCSVINALLGVDLAIAVTEPTPLGQHDLNLIAQVIEKLEIDYKIIINQSNLGNIDLITSKFDPEKIIGQIPHCQKIVQAYINQKLLDLDSHRIQSCLKEI
jgi:MinD superfamily P-loop ATPase